MRRAAALLLGAALLAGCERGEAPASETAPPSPSAAPSVPQGPNIDTPPPSAATVITPDGLGPVRVGMTEADALGALGVGWRTATPIEDSPGSCRHIVRGPGEDGPYWPVSYMLEQGRVVRVEVSGPDPVRPMEGAEQAAAAIRSERGIRLGSTEADVRAAYGPAIQAEPHTYDDPPAQYLNVWTHGGPPAIDRPAPPESRGIQFVTDRNRRVVMIHAGGPAMQYVEGCA